MRIRQPRTATQQARDTLRNRVRRSLDQDSFGAFCRRQHARLAQQLHTDASGWDKHLAKGDGLGRETIQTETTIESRGHTAGYQGQ